MRSGGFWKTDWFLGLVVALVLLLGSNSDLLQSLERKAYDLGVQYSSRTPSDKIAVIAIDDQSLANIGRWPWSREIHAKMTDSLVATKAKVIGNAVLFLEPQLDPGLAYVNRLQEIYGKVVPPGQSPANPDIAQFGATLEEAEKALNTDRKLAESYGKAGSVLLPMLFTLGEPRGKPDKALPDYIQKNQITIAQGAEFSALPSSQVQIPIEALGTQVAAIGHLNANKDVDGGIRTEPLVVAYYGQYYPSLALMIAARSLNLEPKDIKIGSDQVRLGNLKIATDPAAQMLTYFYKDRDGRPAFKVDSFFDVMSGKIPLDNYRDKIVLIGGTASGTGEQSVTPISAAMPPVLTLANSVSSILQEHFFIAPTWGFWVEKLAFLLIAGYLIVLLPRLGAGMGAGITLTLFVALLITHFVLMTGPGIWLQLMVPATLLLVGHLLLTTKRFLVTERGKLKSDADSAESNRMLGLAFQGQGQLDMAFDKFRKCPMDKAVMENLYNLALDFERKRQFNKAESVFRYMFEFDPTFRDLEARLGRAKQLSETVILGGGGGRTNSSILDATAVAGSVEKPMLGRYQIEKELGKGAMGVVYLGKDPKISRTVAIKTMALSQEFDADEIEDVKERFFREAETAGRLNHPNIVTIFDAGEEHDLAYIAMEFLKGKDLVPHTKPDNLLPLPAVMSIIARVADALSYAHAQNVVHRDIKPANIMYEAASDSVKVTDFGIARITDSSKTKTGMVLGTPSYMSPEQLSGKKIDGRSDLFSLVVSMYQMISGRLPFTGDSMAQLMFRIANEQPVNILEYNAGLQPGLVAIIDKGLAKDADQRYQAGDELAREIRACMAGMPAIDIAL